MTLVARINQEKYDSLPEAIKAEYKKQDDGMFIPDIESVDGWRLEDVDGLKSAYAASMTAKKEAEKKLKEFEGLDVVKAREAIQKLEEMANWKPEEKVQEKINAVKSQLVEKHTEELSQRDTTIEGLTGQLEKVLIEAAAIKAITENKGNVDLLLPHVKAVTKMQRNDNGDYVVEVIGPDGNPQISMKPGSTAPMSIAEKIALMKNSETFAPAFEGTGASGSGASGGGKGGYTGNNPFAKKTLNLTEQMKLMKENPALANKLKAEAASVGE